jgi:anti-anti-sigma factor
VDFFHASDATGHLSVGGRDGRWVLRLHGELDASQADWLADLLGVAADQRPRELIVDLSALDFLDCGALAVLVAARQRLADHDGRLVVTGARPIVARLLAVTGLDRCLAAELPGGPRP